MTLDYSNGDRVDERRIVSNISLSVKLHTLASIQV
jgi:hypothetical protein